MTASRRATGGGSGRVTPPGHADGRRRPIAATAAAETIPRTRGRGAALPGRARLAVYSHMPYASVRAAPARNSASRRRELALQLAVLTGISVVLALLLAAGIYVHRQDAGEGQRQADLEVLRTLGTDEQVLARARVTQRHWWDHFRATQGVLVATAGRVLYVGAVPPALLRPNATTPPAFEVRSFVYDTSLSATRQRVWFGTSRGLVLHTPGNTATFAVRTPQRSLADSIVRLVEGRRLARVAAVASERFSFDSVAALPPPPPEEHVVRPGETLIGLAAQYGVTPDQLKLMNGLTEDRIRINQRLVVKRFRRVNGAVVEFYGAAERR